MKGNSRMEFQMVKGDSLTLMEGSGKENGRVGRYMVKEHSLTLMMEESMLEDGRMTNFMVKEHTLYLMEKSMLGDLRMGKEMVLVF